MRFHHKIILAALGLSLIVASARALPGGEERARDLTDPGFWSAMGQGLIGVEEGGWCSCS